MIWLCHLFLMLNVPQPFTAEWCTTTWQGVRFKFPNNAAYALAKYGHSCTAFLGFFPVHSNLGNYASIQHSRKECCFFRMSSSHTPPIPPQSWTRFHNMSTIQTVSVVQYQHDMKACSLNSKLLSLSPSLSLAVSPPPHTHTHTYGMVYQNIY
jgi:hypothetical protein